MAFGTVVLALLMTFMAGSTRQISIVLRMRIHFLRIFRNSSLSYFLIEAMAGNARFVSVFVLGESGSRGFFTMAGSALDASCYMSVGKELGCGLSGSKADDKEAKGCCEQCFHFYYPWNYDRSDFLKNGGQTQDSFDRHSDYMKLSSVRKLGNFFAANLTEDEAFCQVAAALINELEGRSNFTDCVKSGDRLEVPVKNFTFGVRC